LLNEHKHNWIDEYVVIDVIHCSRKNFLITARRERKRSKKDEQYDWNLRRIMLAHVIFTYSHIQKMLRFCDKSIIKSLFRHEIVISCKKENYLFPQSSLSWELLCFTIIINNLIIITIMFCIAFFFLFLLFPCVRCLEQKAVCEKRNGNGQVM